jgi:hypothetical protein
MHNAHDPVRQRSPESDLWKQVQPRLLVYEARVRGPRAGGSHREGRILCDRAADPAPQSLVRRQPTKAAYDDSEYEDTQLLEQRVSRLRRTGMRVSHKVGNSRSVMGGLTDRA